MSGGKKSRRERREMEEAEGEGRGKKRGRGSSPFCAFSDNRRTAIPSTLGRGLFRIISIHGRDLKKRTFIGMLWIWILEP